MGDEPRKKGEGVQKGEQPARKDRRPGAGHSPKRAADPIFSAPYEPASQAPEAPKAAEPQQKGKRKQPQVAALLGGLKQKAV